MPLLHVSFKSEGCPDGHAQHSHKQWSKCKTEKNEDQKNVLSIEWHCPIAVAAQVPHESAIVNLLFIQNHLQKLIDSNKLIECVCGAVSSFILLIQFNSVSFPPGTVPLLLKTLACCKKGPGTTGS